MLRALTFGFWGTLYQNAYAREERLDLLSNVLNQHGQSRPLDELEAAVEHAKSAWEEVWQREQRSISIDRWLDEFLGQLGVTLPILHTLGELEALPNEAAHIGDLPETDLRGARNVGMKAVLFLGVSHREDGRPLADAAFADYSELDELLEELE